MISIYEWLEILNEGETKRSKAKRKQKEREEEGDKRKEDIQKLISLRATLPPDVASTTFIEYGTNEWRNRQVDETFGPLYYDETCTTNFRPMLDLTNHVVFERIPQRAGMKYKQILIDEIRDILNIPLVKCFLVNTYEKTFNGRVTYDLNNNPSGSTNHFGITTKERNKNEDISFAVVVDKKPEGWLFTVKTVWIGPRDKPPLGPFIFQKDHRVIQVHKKFRMGWRDLGMRIEESRSLMTFEQFIGLSCGCN